MQDPENGLESPPAYECPPRAPAKPWEVPTPMVTRGGKQTLAKEAAAAEQAKIKLEQATEEEKKEARVAEEDKRALEEQLRENRYQEWYSREEAPVRLFGLAFHQLKTLYGHFCAVERISAHKVRTSTRNLSALPQS